MASKPLELASPAGELADFSGGILAVIARAAADPNVDVDKLERLLAMQERVLAREAAQAFTVAMKAAQEEAEPIKRNKKNASTNSSYTDLEKLSKELDPISHRHGFTLSFGSGESSLKDHYRVTCDVAHIAGHEKLYFLDVPVDMTGIKGNQNKTATHGFGSALSYGRRYLKLLIFDVATTDDDGQAAGRGKTVDDAQLASLQNLASGVGADLQRFCEYFGVPSLAAIPVSRFDEATAALQAKAKKPGADK